MRVDVGSLSADGRWYWDGQAWKPTRSADGHWRWDGTTWVPGANMPAAPWKPPWTQRDTKMLITALIGVPVMLLGIFGVLVWTNPGVGGWVGWLVAGFVSCGIGAGVLVRPRGRWWESVLLAGVLATSIAFASLCVGVAATDQKCDASHQQRQSDCETVGYGLGAALGGSAMFVGILPLALGGKALARVTRRRQETTA